MLRFHKLGGKMHLFIKMGGVVLVAGVGLLFSGVSLRSRPSAAPPTAQDVYLDKCSVCHGQDGAGNTAKGRKLKVQNVRSPEVQKLSEAEMIDIVAKGKGKDMPGFGKELGDDMVKQVVAYYRSLAKS
jgi:mono/diheme cytochrome c family protein